LEPSIDSSEFEFAYDIEKIKREIARAFWGLVEPLNTEDRWQDNKSFDDYFCVCESYFMKKLKELFDSATVKIHDKEIKLRDDPKVIFGEEEGELHRFLKVFCLYHLIHNEEKEWEHIKIEETTQDEIRPDISINDEEIYEIETFYGRGKPDERVSELIKKYQNEKPSAILSIVISNIDAILWYNKLIELKKYKKNEGFNVNFLTVDISQKKLIKIEDLKKFFEDKIQSS